MNKFESIVKKLKNINRLKEKIITQDKCYGYKITN